jgi:ribonuclease Z
MQSLYRHVKIGRYFLAAAATATIIAALNSSAWATGARSVVKVTVEPIIKIVVLGSGTPVPSTTQAGAAILVQAGGEHFLFDCGRGCSTRLAQYNPALISRIDKLFITHLHSDHVVGIPDIWLNGWTQGRAGPLRVWGPEGSADLMEGLRSAYAADIGYRTSPGSPDPTPIKRDVRTIDKDGVVFDQGGVRITAFRVIHANIPAFGYRVDYGGKSVLISGDATVSPNLVTYGKGVDVALLEVASPAMIDFLERTFSRPVADRIVGTHLTADQAGAIFSEINPRLAIYYHTVGDCAANPDLTAKTRQHFKGRLEISQDLTAISIFADKIDVRSPSETRKCGGTKDVQSLTVPPAP